MRSGDRLETTLGITSTAGSIVNRVGTPRTRSKAQTSTLTVPADSPNRLASGDSAELNPVPISEPRWLQAGAGSVKPGELGYVNLTGQSDRRRCRTPTPTQPRFLRFGRRQSVPLRVSNFPVSFVAPGRIPEQTVFPGERIADARTARTSRPGHRAAVVVGLGSELADIDSRCGACCMKQEMTVVGEELRKREVVRRGTLRDRSWLATVGRLPAKC